MRSNRSRAKGESGLSSSSGAHLFGGCRSRVGMGGLRRDASADGVGGYGQGSSTHKL